MLSDRLPKITREDKVITIECNTEKQAIKVHYAILKVFHNREAVLKYLHFGKGEDRHD